MRNGFPVAGRGMVVGLPGGSFDPAHEGHVHITHEAIKRLGLGRESGMRVIWVIAAVMWAGAALAEDVVVTQEGNTTYVTVVGNLAPTQDPGCKGLAYSEDDLSPPDLFLGVIDCLGKGRGESAAGMAILMLARTAYDTKRVTDQTAHDAGQVLMMQMRQSLLTEKQELLDAQMKRMTEPGSPAFQNVCLALVFKGPPTHSPYYMISHGIKAITGDGGLPLVEPFDAKAAWDAVRKDYLHCPF